jgi:hypothetical protein
VLPPELLPELPLEPEPPLALLLLLLEPQAAITSAAASKAQPTDIALRSLMFLLNLLTPMGSL